MRCDSQNDISAAKLAANAGTALTALMSSSRFDGISSKEMTKQRQHERERGIDEGIEARRFLAAQTHAVLDVEQREVVFRPAAGRL